MSETNHLFVATTPKTHDEGTVEIFCGPSIEWLKDEGYLDEFEVRLIRQIPDDFYMTLDVQGYTMRHEPDPRFFFASPGGAGQGSAIWLAEAVDCAGHISSADKEPFLPILYPVIGRLPS